MSNWNGKAGKGAMAARRKEKREDAEFRQAHFDADVDRVMHEQNVTRQQAYDVVVVRRKFDRSLRIP